jgi:predicted phosphodiesterase
VRIAALYDIHGNLPALEAVVLEIRRVGVDLIVVGGDVLPGPMPRETMACLESLDVPAQLIHGNGDREVLAAISGTETLTLPAQALEAIRWTARQLRPEDERVLAGWPATVRLEVDGVGAVLFCHATPRNDTDIFTRLTPEDRLLPIFDAVDTPVVVCGHTHMQFDRFVGRTRVVNAGSVGMPFQEPGAYWLLLGPGAEFRHTRYDLTDAAERIRATSYPQAEAFAARNVLQTPSEGEMLKVFTATGLGA